MKTNTSNIPPAPVNFDYITLHDALVRKVTDYSPSPRMRQNWASINIPGQYNFDDLFGVVLTMHAHGVWCYELFIKNEWVAIGVACVLDENSQPEWVGIRRGIEETDPQLLSDRGPDYLRRFGEISPNQGFLCVRATPALAKYPCEWAALTTLLYQIYWKAHAETARLSVSGQIFI